MTDRCTKRAPHSRGHTIQDRYHSGTVRHGAIASNLAERATLLGRSDGAEGWAEPKVVISFPAR